MILLLSDVHCLYEVVNDQLQHAAQRLGRLPEAVVVLGDVGIFEPNLSRYFRRAEGRFLRPVYYIEGNHEDHERLPWLAAAYADCLVHYGRASVQTLDGHRFLCLGGAAYMDAHTTPLLATIGPGDIRHCLEHAPQEVDIILSHDCPAGIGVPNSPGFEHYGPPGFPEGERLLAHFAPRLWVFGHHHKWFDRTLDRTRFVGLAQSWTGYGLLDSDGTLQVVRHEVPRRASLWERLRRRLRRPSPPPGAGP